MKWTAISALVLLGCSATSGSADPETSETTETAGTGGAIDSMDSGGTPGSGGLTVSTGGTGTGGQLEAGPCGDPAVLVCEDFEAHTPGEEPLDPWEVTVDKYNATTAFAVISDEQAHSGSFSVNVSGGSDWGNRILVGYPSIFPVESNHFFARFWVYFAEDVPESGHSTYALATGPIPEQDPASAEEVRLGFHSGILNINFKGPLLGDPSQFSWKDPSHSVGVYPISHQWVCTEIEIDGENQVINFWRDDEELEWLHVGEEEVEQMGLPSEWAPEFIDFRFGWQAYGTKAMVAYYDDVVISAERIGCGGA